VLGCGAGGVSWPHVTAVVRAETLGRAVHCVPGGRGIAGTTRAGGYGEAPLAEHRALARDEVSLICQIEDSEGVECVEEIAAVPDVDALFVGRADLSVSYGHEFGSPEIDRICGEILGLKGAATGLYCAPDEDIGRWRDKGASFFVTGSDHMLLQRGAKSLAAGFASDYAITGN